MTLVTEKEAAEKWCPLVRAHGDNMDANVSRCIGSKCMAWRKGPDRIEEGWRDLHNRPVSVAVGYCGAFGKVEP